MTHTVSRLTLRDVAERVGIHPATASRALNESTRHLVSEDTARRVTEAALEMGYTPNSIARSLKTSRSLTVGVVLPDLTNPLFPPMVRGIEDALMPAGFTALIANTDNDEEHARQVVHALRLRQVDGWISAIATLGTDLTDLAGTPLVLLNRQDDHGTPAVVGDDRGGIVQAIEHLIALGHRRIAHVAGPQALSTGSARHHAYLELMAERGLDRRPDLVRFGDAFTEQEGARALRSLLDGPGRFTAVLAGNDLMALGCYEALAERGLRCPGRHLGGRLQRHAVRRPLLAAADDDADPPPRDGAAGGRAAARADRRRARRPEPDGAPGGAGRRAGGSTAPPARRSLAVCA